MITENEIGKIAGWIYDCEMKKLILVAKESAEREREECAKLCDERVEMCKRQLDGTNDMDDIRELKSLEFQFSVLAALIRNRSKEYKQP